MQISFERLAMRADIHHFGNGAIITLAEQYNVTPRSVYGWIENGFPEKWSQIDLEKFRERIIQITGGGNLIAHFRSLGQESVSSATPTTAMRGVSDVVGDAAALLKTVTLAVADGKIDDSEQADLEAALATIHSELARLDAQIRAMRKGN